MEPVFVEVTQTNAQAALVLLRSAAEFLAPALNGDPIPRVYATVAAIQVRSARTLLGDVI